ncbi:unnamed protein product [Linum tenue]|uniref:RNase H type-1 domain-containing protein n=1 Tax=Linum tenue TaxID=586396 RepID=A0AAV0LN14_9ROSI|nr:unnamed protein product [Linum tenue]
MAQGLRCAWEVGIRKAILQTDSKIAIHLLESAATTHPHFTTVSEIRHLLQRDWQVRIEHVFREGNVVADYLASTGHSSSPGVHIINQPSSMLNYWLLFDQLGVETPRFVPT